MSAVHAHAASGRALYDRAPLRIYWELTRACDLACGHCRAEATPRPDPDELDARESRELLEALAGFGSPLPHLVLTGGDPLKRRDLWELIGDARRRGFPVALAPSATPLLTVRVVRHAKAAGVEAMSLSLDGATAETHDRLRGVTGCFDRTVELAGECAAVGLPLQINTLVSEETRGELRDIHAVVAALGAARWSLFFLVQTGRGRVLQPISAAACEAVFAEVIALGDSGRPVITTTEAPHFRRIVREHARAARISGATRRPPVGHVAGIRDGNGIMFISHAGEVCPSGFLPVSAGNVRLADPVQLYRHSGLFRALRRPDLFPGRCGRCEYRDECGGSRSRAWALTRDPLGDDPLCRYEPAAAR